MTKQSARHAALGGEPSALRRHAWVPVWWPIGVFVGGLLIAGGGGWAEVNSKLDENTKSVQAESSVRALADDEIRKAQENDRLQRLKDHDLVIETRNDVAWLVRERGGKPSHAAHP